MKKILLFPFILFFCSSPQSRSAKVIEPQGLVLRDKPSMQGKQLTLMKDNEEVLVQRDDGPEETLFGRKSRWFEVKYKGLNGYAFGGFLEYTGKEDKTDEDFGTVEEDWGQYLGRIYWYDAKSMCASLGMRLPTLKELASVYNSKLKEEWEKKGRFYWSSEDLSDEEALSLNISYGYVSSDRKKMYYYGHSLVNCRCIRRPQELVANSSKTAASAAAPESWSPFQGKERNWYNAKSKCASLGMRLPTLKELAKVDKSNLRREWKTDSSFYWSSEELTKEQALGFNIEKGYVDTAYKNAFSFFSYPGIRCIR